MKPDYVNKTSIEDRKKERGWCVKHQCVHRNSRWWQSCKFPNDHNRKTILSGHKKATYDDYWGN